MAKPDTKCYNDLITDIAGEIITEEKEDTDEYTSPAMERGVELESEAVNYMRTCLNYKKSWAYYADEDNEFC